MILTIRSGGTWHNSRIDDKRTLEQCAESSAKQTENLKIVRMENLDGYFPEKKNQNIVWDTCLWIYQHCVNRSINT